TGEEEVDDPIDVGTALLAQFPQVILKMAHERFARKHIAQAELLHGPAKAGERLHTELVEECFNRDCAVLFNVKLIRPFLFQRHIRILVYAAGGVKLSPHCGCASDPASYSTTRGVAPCRSIEIRIMRIIR